MDSIPRCCGCAVHLVELVVVVLPGSQLVSCRQLKCVEWILPFVGLFLFFFSSRRRHTRSLCDWSSDVCSSDLSRCRPAPAGFRACPRSPGGPSRRRAQPRSPSIRRSPARARDAGGSSRSAGEIGRASCRERVEKSVVVEGGQREVKEAWVTMRV